MFQSSGTHLFSFSLLFCFCLVLFLLCFFLFGHHGLLPSTSWRLHEPRPVNRQLFTSVLYPPSGRELSNHQIDAYRLHDFQASSKLLVVSTATITLTHFSLNASCCLNIGWFTHLLPSVTLCWSSNHPLSAIISPWG